MHFQLNRVHSPGVGPLLGGPTVLAMLEPFYSYGHLGAVPVGDDWWW